MRFYAACLGLLLGNACVLPEAVKVDDAPLEVTVGGGGGAAGGGGGAPEPCPSLHGPTMVAVPYGTAGYCIDSTEVTYAQYDEFLVMGAASAAQDPVCTENADFAPALDGAPGTGDHPVVGVDWCDAAAYCRWAGKRLCGRVADGGSIDLVDGGFQVLEAEWYFACTKAGVQDFPYGRDEDPTACNVDEVGLDGTAPVGSFTQCQGGYPGIFDMVGNVYEWMDVCDPPPGDGCVAIGGSWEQEPTSVPACDLGAVVPRMATISNGGFRCCMSAD